MADSNQFYKSAIFQYQGGGKTYLAQSNSLLYTIGENSNLQKVIGDGGADVSYAVGNLDITYTFYLEEPLLTSLPEYSYLNIADDLFYGVDGDIQVPIVNVRIIINQDLVDIAYQIVGNELRIPIQELIPYFDENPDMTLSIVVTIYYPTPNANPLLMNSLEAAQIVGDQTIALSARTIGGGRIVEGILTLSENVEYEGEYLRFNDQVTVTVVIKNTANIDVPKAVIPIGNFVMNLAGAGFTFDYWIIRDSRIAAQQGIVTNIESLEIPPSQSIVIQFTARFGT